MRRKSIRSWLDMSCSRAHSRLLACLLHFDFFSFLKNGSILLCFVIKSDICYAYIAHHAVVYDSNRCNCCSRGRACVILLFFGAFSCNRLKQSRIKRIATEWRIYFNAFWTDLLSKNQANDEKMQAISDRACLCARHNRFYVANAQIFCLNLAINQQIKKIKLIW